MIYIWVISCDIYDRNIDNTMCDFYQRSHGLINEFRTCDCTTLDNLHIITYCMQMYGCDLWNLNEKKLVKSCIAKHKTPTLKITDKSPLLFIILVILLMCV